MSGVPRERTRSAPSARASRDLQRSAARGKTRQRWRGPPDYVDVLKVQHHGSEQNIDADFCRKLSADHYVFCGNGEHGNPELDVIELIYRSRVGDNATRALSPNAQERNFTFWFSTTAKYQKEGRDERKRFEEVETFVATLKTNSGGRMKVKFNKNAAISFEV